MSCNCNDKCILLCTAEPRPPSPCANSPCQNQGRCLDDSSQPMGYRCVCIGPWIGPTCTDPGTASCFNRCKILIHPHGISVCVGPGVVQYTLYHALHNPEGAQEWGKCSFKFPPMGWWNIV